MDKVNKNGIILITSEINVCNDYTIICLRQTN